MGEIAKSWIPFKYENLPMFCFGCGRTGHVLKEYKLIPVETRKLSKEELPYSLALKDETNNMGKESMKFGVRDKMSMKQKNYVGQDKSPTGGCVKLFEESTISKYAKGEQMEKSACPEIA